jgi:predicted CxxxxCH...CXXCH cytochrome family protein
MGILKYSSMTSTMRHRLSCLLTMSGMFLLAVTLLAPSSVEASVATVNQFPATPQLVSNASTGTVASSAVTVGAGSNRVMVITVVAKYTTTQGSPSFTVTYGGKPLIQLTNNTSQLSTTWVGYLKETDLAAAGSGQIFTVTNSNTTNLVAMYGSAAVYSGVEQVSSPFSGSASTNTASATTMTVPAYTATGLAANTGMSVYISNWAAGTIGAVSSGYTAVNYAGTNSKLAIGYKAVSATSTTEAPTSTISAATNGTMVAFGLLPYASPSLSFAVTLCTDCHGYPPVDGTSRNNPAGTFPGSHNKHSGSAINQYSYTCGTCHYNATTTNHSTGFKNITGSRVPGNAYSQTKKVPISNSPTLGTCNNVTCHSTGRTNVQYANALAWGQTGTCLSCHGGRNGPAGNPAKSVQGFGLSTTHSQHLKYSAVTTIMNCNVCHSKTATDAATLKNYSGVIYHANGQPNVLFTNLTYASYTSYKTATKKCSNTSCHGGTSRSAWTNQGAINSNHTCTHCHGVPTGIPANNTNRNFYAPGWGGTGTSTDNISVNTDIRVGAHFVHLSSVYAKKMKCNECHAVPSTPFEGNHMNTLRYNSTTLTFAQASSAVLNSVSPAFVAGTPVAAATCTTTYCHGSSMKNGDTSGTDRSPAWNSNLTTGTPGTAECARCHGNPPTAGTTALQHSGYAATVSCNGCHSPVVSPSGAIINKSLHMNGSIDTLMACNSCHAYDSTDTWNSTFGVEGVGAHVKHIAYIKTRWNITLAPATDTFGGANMVAVCGVCHTVTPAEHTTGGGGSRLINFGSTPTARQFGASAPSYGGVSGTSSAVNQKRCSNIDCHYMTTPLWSTY